MPVTSLLTLFDWGNTVPLFTFSVQYFLPILLYKSQCMLCCVWALNYALMVLLHEYILYLSSCLLFLFIKILLCSCWGVMYVLCVPCNQFAYLHDPDDALSFLMVTVIRLFYDPCIQGPLSSRCTATVDTMEKTEGSFCISLFLTYFH